MSRDLHGSGVFDPARKFPTSPRNQLSFFSGTALGASGDAVFTHADQHLAKLPLIIRRTYSPSVEEEVVTAEIAQADLSSRLRSAVVAAAVNSAGSMAELRIAICAFTVARRNEGGSPEAVLIALKRVISDETFESLGNLSTWDGNHLHQRISTWCIEDYFSRTECSAVV